jgi:hypothetical protein
MTIARRELIDVSITRWYHCISECVRGALLLGKGKGTFNRKEWLENRIKQLAQIFAVAVGGYSVLNNHLHVLVRLDPDVGTGWTDEEVVRRWGCLFPPRDKSRKPLTVCDDWVREQLEDKTEVAKFRERLQSISWFMKCLKEPLARLANDEDDCRGAFWAARYKSKAILDDEALLAVGIYIDLNPVAAGIARTPEESHYTSASTRVEHIQAQGADAVARLEAAKQGSVAGSVAAVGLEEKLWLCPIEDRRQFDSSREGMFEGLSIGNYLLLVDYTGRLFRKGKARISDELAGILERIGSSAEVWRLRMEKLKTGRWFGRFFATRQEKLQAMANQLKVRRLVNLAGCPVT